MKDFFKHQLKSYSRAIIVITVIMLIAGFFINRDIVETKYTEYYSEEYGKYVNKYYHGYDDYRYDEDGYDDYGYYDEDDPSIKHHETFYGFYEEGEMVKVNEAIELNYRKLPLGYSTTMIMLLSLCVPVWMFAFLKKKRNLDCCYSLPITRRQIGVTQYLVGLVAVAVPFVSTYLLAIIMHICYGGLENARYGYVLAHFGICLLAGFVVYSFASFAFNEANSTLDGIVLIIAYLLVFLVALSTFETVWNEIVYATMPKHPNVEEMDCYYQTLHSRSIYFNAELGIHWVYFANILGDYQYDAVHLYSARVAYSWKEAQQIVWIIAWSIIGVASAFFTCFRFEKRTAESAEEQSSGIFAYKTLIPVYAFMLVASALCEFDAVTPCLFVTIGTAIAYTVYRRGVRYKKSDYIIVGILFAITVAAFLLGGM